MKVKIAVGDVVEHFGLDFTPLPWWKKILYYPKWWYGDIVYWLKKQYQRIRYGFPLEESWSFNSACAKWALPRLKKLRQNCISHPVSLCGNDHQEHFIPCKEAPITSTDESKCSEAKWHEILDKIIWSFEHFDDMVDPVYPDDYDHRQVVTEVSDRGIRFSAVDKREIDWTPVNEHAKKLQEGFELFGKHFQDLWD